MSDKIGETSPCPICNKSFPVKEIESHANKCIFLNGPNDNVKRKRSSISPSGGPPSKLAPIFHKSSQQNGATSNILKPLAKQVQPTTIDEFFGQEHVLGEQTVLHTLLKKGDIPNMVLWGPPGCGKTSLASIVQHICKASPETLHYTALCAASSGVKDVQSVIDIAANDLKNGKKTVLFLDEIHKFNKKQQDVFLTPVEEGQIVLIGATTDNPSIALNNALLSRCRVIVMEKLSQENLINILKRAADKMKIDVLTKDSKDKIENDGIYIEESALKFLADTCDGDARIALNDLEMILKYFNHEGKVITTFDVKEGVKKSHLLYDRKGDEHYNMISAVHKSIRGSDPNAALYWTTRMMLSGENPLFIARRFVRAASEDIGEKDPQALQLAVSTMHGCQMLGMPESDVLLAQCAVYLAKAPKSRSIDSALAKAKKVISEFEGAQPSVPLHLRNAPTKLMKELGYGKGKDDTFLPPDLKNVNFFK